QEQVRQYQHNAGQLAQKPSLALLEHFSHGKPELIRQVFIVERQDLVRVPELKGAEEIPVRPSQKCSQNNERHPQHHEAEQKHAHSKFSLGKREVAVAFLVEV